MQYLDLTLPTIEENLALDEALLLEVEDGRRAPMLRLWEATDPAVVLGASGRIREDVVVERCEAEGVAIARRSSGGGTVVVGPGALNVSVVLPRDAAPGLDAVDFAQLFVLGRVAESLRQDAPDLEVRGSGDLTVLGRKVSGSAQRRLRTHFLVHASILYNFPLDRIGHLTRMPARQPSYRAGRPHDAFVANLAIPRPRLVQRLREAWDALQDPDGGPEWPEDRVKFLVAEKFGDPGWTWRL